MDKLHGIYSSGSKKRMITEQSLQHPGYILLGLHVPAERLPLRWITMLMESKSVGNGLLPGQDINPSNHVSAYCLQEMLNDISEVQHDQDLHMFILYYFFNRKPHLRAMCTINHLPLYRSHWRWLSQTCYWHLLLPYWMPRSLISTGATWISLWSEHLKQKQIQVEKQPVTACCFITPENTRGKEGDRDAHLLEFNNTFLFHQTYTAILFCNTHAHTSSSYTTC